MARGASKWPEKNPESKAFPGMATPLSTTAPGGDPRPGYEQTVPENAEPGNPVGYTGLERGKKRK